jgi:cytochrome b561
MGDGPVTRRGAADRHADFNVTALDPRHPDGEYSRVSKWFHWITVPLIVILLLSGLTIRFIADEPKIRFYMVHESLGLLVLLLSTARLTWRLTHRPPAMASHLPPIERSGANAVHHAVYVVLIVQPILGFLTTNAYGFPQRDDRAFLGFINLPKFMDANVDLAHTLHWAHSIVGWLLIPLLAMHVTAVVYHHAIKGDGTLMRMI